MKIEILIPDRPPKIYPLIKDETTLGSSDTADIQILYEGISKLHLAIYKDKNKFFVSDLGSHNGTFLNHEKLAPNVRVEFTPTTPLMLSKDVIVGLILEEEVLDEATPVEKVLDQKTPLKEDQTRIFSLKDLEQSKSEDVVKKRLELRKKNREFYTKKSLDQSNRKLTFFLSIVFVFIISIYFLKKNRDPQSNVSSSPKLTPLIEKEIKTSLVKKENKEVLSSSGVKLKLLVEKNIPHYDVFFNNLTKDKCASPFEKNLCSEFRDMNLKSSGVLVVDKKILIYLHRKSMYLDAVNLLRSAPQKDSPAASQHQQTSDAIKLMFLTLIRNHPSLNWKNYEDYDFYYIFYVNQDFGPMIFSVVGISSQNIPILKAELNQDFFNKVKRHGSIAFENMSEVLKLHHTKSNIPPDFDLWPLK